MDQAPCQPALPLCSCEQHRRRQSELSSHSSHAFFIHLSICSSAMRWKNDWDFSPQYSSVISQPLHTWFNSSANGVLDSSGGKPLSRVMLWPSWIWIVHVCWNEISASARGRAIQLKFTKVSSQNSLLTNVKQLTWLYGCNSSYLLTPKYERLVPGYK